MTPYAAFQTPLNGLFKNRSKKCNEKMQNHLKITNKRAQRALGRSPEKKVKGQGEAIYRGPLMLSTKYW